MFLPAPVFRRAANYMTLILATSASRSVPHVSDCVDRVT